ncbi:dihydrodipicolinate reductase [Frankia sp. AgB1.9]|uniref:NAD(P)H-dependent amine dehydrogenase family protein n=1 Tax=unclassified Frankia TaxID=2632575 RepID=UPI0019336185|nr:MULTISPECIES: dihydrodipicolinate reductase [unclassified Frankia]MBL7487232.1 dihydrodipicolinate reductase [Frankia sp. AgW1.1]MBL7547978.1 dihydrodipicolinate reductase [Frankia sp. AgB1.9]MBL7625029.1 dihydrodipicolinate reductase [Frankia sp. AgB1.8]
MAKGASNGGQHSGKTYRVVQWAAGRMGQKAIRGIVEHPYLELVGLYVHSESKVGQDAGVLAGIDPIGIRATHDIEDVVALQPDCVLYMQEGFDLDDLTRLLSSGINVITTRNEFFYASAMDPAIRALIEEACQRGRTSIHATGSSPGYSTTTMPLTLLYPMRRFDELTIDEYADIPASVGPEMIKLMGFGSPVATTELSPARMGTAFVGYQQSLAALADAIGLPLDGFEVRSQVARATKPYTLSDGYVIEAGTMAAQRNTVAGMRDGKPLLTFRSHWFCTQDLDQDWNVGGEGWLFTTKGDAPMQVRVTYGTTDEGYSQHLAGYTATPAVNTIPYLVAAEPGIRTIFDLPPIVPFLGPA